MEVLKCENHSNRNGFLEKSEDCVFGDYQVNENQAILTQGHQGLQVDFDSLTPPQNQKSQINPTTSPKKKRSFSRVGKSQKDRDFIYALNAKGIYSFELSQNKLFAWLKAYREGGIEALRDERGKNRLGVNKIKELGLEDEVISLLKARAKSGSVNIGLMHHALHILTHQKG